MTKKSKSTAQKKARALQAETGMPYTAALAKIQDEIDEGLCTSEYHGDDLGFVGQLCELEDGHGGVHRCDTDLPGTRYTVTLTWG
ncbi:hypothetical protein N4G70_29085 [Streptomyces sp. ASQP_92]|uniref:hypothetical protein n=1 Tax=Streptomyces sp. ASQP_92 TaxID=2979116 RepID=UPI0021C1319D|nr:hypothetical protein [Streptomyces sp. ASQP_92]MCT9092896.1 hypothetical protein [Streptomyces sp. ASQP_92]